MKTFVTTLLIFISSVSFAQQQVNEHQYSIKVKENNSNVQELIKDLKAKKGVENLKYNEAKKEITFAVGIENQKGNDEKTIISLIKRNNVVYDDLDIKSSHNSSRSQVKRKKR